jgi:urease accessory protein
MFRATAIVPRAAVRPERVADRITLDHGDRHRRRIALTGQGGLAFLLDLDRATLIEDGDAVALEDGRLVEVRAAPERLVEITSEDALLLKKVIWHLGNRHVPAEIAEDAVYIAEDHVLVEMVRGLGARARRVERPFRPERGAYDGVNGHEH